MVEPNQYELSRRAAAVNELLGRIGLSSGQFNEWWNRTAYAELGGLTPTQAWLCGNHDAVVQLVQSWIERSDEAAERARNDPGFLQMINERQQAITADEIRRRTA